MLAKCPKNSNHKLFITVAHVAEDWLVDSKGNWQETLGTLETTALPDVDNTWVCHICGTEAIVKED